MTESASSFALANENPSLLSRMTLREYPKAVEDSRASVFCSLTSTERLREELRYTSARSAPPLFAPSRSREANSRSILIISGRGGIRLPYAHRSNLDMVIGYLLLKGVIYPFGNIFRGRVLLSKRKDIVQECVVKGRGHLIGETLQFVEV